MSDNKQGLNPPLTSGWPVCYDITIDQYRLVQQADVDKWIRVTRSYGRLVNLIRREHVTLMTECNTAFSPHDTVPTEPRSQSTDFTCDTPSCIDSEP